MDAPGHVVRNQIDYILINKRFTNTITSVKTYPEAYIKSDHNHLITMNLKLKEINPTKQPTYDSAEIPRDWLLHNDTQKKLIRRNVPNIELLVS